MTKSEVKSIIDKAGGARDHQSPSWNDAFNLYNQAPENRYSQLRKGSCGSCFRKVYEWLSK